MEIQNNYLMSPSFSDIDGYQIAHHSKYFCWFEDARFDFLNRKLKMNVQEIENIKVLITNISCQYKRPALFGNKYEIRTTFVFDIKKPQFSFKYKMVDAITRKLVCIGYTEHVMINESGGLMLNYPKLFLNKIKQIQRSNNE